MPNKCWKCVDWGSKNWKIVEYEEIQTNYECGHGIISVAHQHILHKDQIY